ncbi:MAG: chlorophyll synthase ChlG [Rhizobiales bacterium]|nr:chlorophyll synthase ChlG [Hyphomicrobiales bacterium]
MDRSVPVFRSVSAPSPRAVLELLKPVTWFAPMWAYGCGIVSSGIPVTGHFWTFAAGVLLCGPLVCGTSQAANDWFDRHVDAINEPNRPIPSGRVPGQWGLWIAIGWSLLSLAVAATLGTWVLVATAFGLLAAWAYSAPPLRLKVNGWWGNSAVGLCYEGLPWFTAVAAMQGGMPPAEILWLALLYSAGAHGIMTLNDFKAVAGDRLMGIGSLPVRLGERRAAILACVVMAVPQVIVAALLVAWNRPLHAGIVALSLVLQMACMVRLLKDPKAHAPWYNGTGVTLYVLGMMAAAIAVRGGLA